MKSNNFIAVTIPTIKYYAFHTLSHLHVVIYFLTEIVNLRSTQPFTLRGTVKWAVTHLHVYGLRKVVTLVQLTGAA